MDNQTLFVIYRIIIALGGIVSIYLGYRLFHISKEKQGKVEIATGQHFRLSASDLAPGIFFALFGAFVLIFSLTHGMALTRGALPENADVPGSSNSWTKSSIDQPPRYVQGGGVEYSTGAPAPHSDTSPAKAPN